MTEGLEREMTGIARDVEDIAGASNNTADKADKADTAGTVGTVDTAANAGNIRLEEILSLGVYKEVYRARSGGREVVLASPSSQPHSQYCLHQEIDFLSRLPPHPNLVGYLGWGKGDVFRRNGISSFFPGGQTPFLLLESLDGDMEEVVSLYGAALLDAENGYSLRVVWGALIDAMVQVARVLCHLEENRIIHLDLKPGNILVGVINEGNFSDEIQPVFKLADFGIAEEMPPGEEWVESGRVGSPLYAAPEVYTHGRASFRTPVYSCGIIFAQLLLGRHPYNSEEGVARAAKGKFQLDLRPVSHLLPRPLTALVRRMSRPNSFERPRMAEVRTILETLALKFPL